MTNKRKNPFRPGWGVTPPHRAGRRDAEHRLDALLERICDREPGGGVILYGPRGTGKTTLLEEVRERATSRGAGVRWLTPTDWKNGLAEFVVGLPDGVVDEAETKLVLGFDIGVLKARVERRKSVPSRTAEDILCGLAKSKPLVLLVDEAHRLPPDIGEVFLNAAQRCVTSKLPVLVVLAGTPEIEANLSLAHASFWERSRLLRIGRLESQDDTRAALSLPAEREGLPFTPEALELLVAESQDYPFFIQLLGEQSWNAAIARDPGADRIGLEDAEAGLRMAEEERGALYGKRLDEIIDRGMKSEARAVSKAFVARGVGGVLSRAELETELEPALTRGRTVDTAIKELFAVGLIWRTRNYSIWEPGIPSLCAFVTEHLKGGDT